jgi:hypothetical protein
LKKKVPGTFSVSPDKRCLAPFFLFWHFSRVGLGIRVRKYAVLDLK